MKKILVIDDEMTIRFLLREAIEDWGYEFLEASRAMQGIEIVKEGGVDLVLLDIQLPQMNGLEAVQRIKEIDENIPVFMVTAFHNLQNVVEMLDVTVQGFVPKPFNIDELEEMIKKQIGE